MMMPKKMTTKNDDHKKMMTPKMMTQKMMTQKMMTKKLMTKMTKRFFSFQLAAFSHLGIIFLAFPPTFTCAPHHSRWDDPVKKNHQ